MTVQNYKVAVVGAGPSGFYAAESLLRSELSIDVDIIEKLPVPYGLVRFGVAPDHPKLKMVTAVFDRIAEMDGCRFIGNINVGTDITTTELSQYYHAVIYAYGTHKGRRPDIAGNDLPGCLTAHEFVAWYNGHPDYRNLDIDLSQGNAVVIGHGNVALDVARILSKSAPDLQQSDIAEHALATLANSQIHNVYVIGRRGPAQAQFVSKELREFSSIPGCITTVDSSEITLNQACIKELESPDNSDRQKTVELLRTYAASKSRDASANRRCLFEFNWMPTNIHGDNHVESVVLQKTVLSGEPFAQKALPEGPTRTLECGLIVFSIGYEAFAIAPFSVDPRGDRLCNEKGRLLVGGKALSGNYTTGWLKRGPQGTIGSNRADSVATAANVLVDLPTLANEKRSRQKLFELLDERCVSPVSLSQWKKINEHEMQRGATSGKPRVKLTDVREMLEVAGIQPA